MLRSLILYLVICLFVPFCMADMDGPVDSTNAISTTREKLAQPIVELRLYNLTPDQAMEKWARSFDLKLRMDWDALTKIGVKKDAIISAQLRDMRGDKALLQIFDLIKGTFIPVYAIEQDGTIVVTDHATLIKKYTAVHEYPVRDLMDIIGKSAPDKAAAEIAKYVKENASPESWKDKGGDVGELSYHDGKLIIRQTEEVHQQVADALNDLRKANVPHPAPPAGDDAK